MKKSKKKVNWKVVLTVVTWIILAIVLAIMIWQSVKIHWYNFDTDRMFSAWLRDNKEMYEKIIVIRPEWKPDFIFQRIADKYSWVIGIGVGWGVDIIGIIANIFLQVFVHSDLDFYFW